MEIKRCLAIRRLKLSLKSLDPEVEKRLRILRITKTKLLIYQIEEQQEITKKKIKVLKKVLALELKELKK